MLQDTKKSDILREEDTRRCVIKPSKSQVFLIKSPTRADSYGFSSDSLPLVFANLLKVEFVDVSQSA